HGSMTASNSTGVARRGSATTSISVSVSVAAAEVFGSPKTAWLGAADGPSPEQPSRVAASRVRMRRAWSIPASPSPPTWPPYGAHPAPHTPPHHFLPSPEPLGGKGRISGGGFSFRPILYRERF